jgi:hypothetical protein
MFVPLSDDPPEAPPQPAIRPAVRTAVTIAVTTFLMFLFMFPPFPGFRPDTAGPVHILDSGLSNY